MEELELKKGVPVLVTPSGALMVVQNSMTTTDDQLLVSEHGDLTKAWMQVGPGDAVKFDQPMHLMQNAWATYVFPVIEKA